MSESGVGGMISQGGILQGLMGHGQNFGFFSKWHGKPLEGLEKMLLLLEAITLAVGWEADCGKKTPVNESIVIILIIANGGWGVVANTSGGGSENGPHWKEGFWTKTSGFTDG